MHFYLDFDHYEDFTLRIILEPVPSLPLLMRDLLQDINTIICKDEIVLSMTIIITLFKVHVHVLCHLNKADEINTVCIST